MFWEKPVKKLIDSTVFVFWRDKRNKKMKCFVPFDMIDFDTRMLN